MDKTSSSTQPTKELLKAINTLEAYSLQQSAPSESSVSKIISLVRSVLSISHDPDDKHILYAIETINRHRLLIAKWNEGTPAEQAVAEQVTKVVNVYNESCDKRVQVHNKPGLSKFFLKDKKEASDLPKISLPKKTTAKHHYPEQISLKENTTPATGTTALISQQSIELFHMKAIALLERYGIASNPEARGYVKTSPIFTNLEANTSICTLTQTLSLFPGQTITVKGNSALNPTTQVINQLFPETFSLSLESTQTGFPHPIQRAGWTVAGQLIPDYPQRLDLLNETAPLFPRKHQAIPELLPNGKFFKSAKMILSLKRQCFTTYAKELIAHQKDLIHTLLKAASAENPAYDCVEKFFETINGHPNPFEALAESAHLIREAFMIKPHQLLLDAIIKGKSTHFGYPDPAVRYLATKTLLNSTLEATKQEMLKQRNEAKLLNDRAKFDYMLCLGDILGQAAQQIFLQYLSEDLVFEPPKLSSFEQKIQTLSYTHLRDFLDEIESENLKNKEDVYQLLKRQLAADKIILEAQVTSSLSHELSNYFQKRFQSLSAL